MDLNEAKQVLKENGYLLETRRMGMHRQVYKQTGGDFEDFMNDNKIKRLYDFVVKEKKKNDKELIADGCDPDEYDSIWNYMENSYYEKLGAAVNNYFGEEKIYIYTRPSTIIIETDNNRYEFDTNSGEWDNIDLGTERQEPIDFFKKLFKIAMEN